MSKPWPALDGVTGTLASEFVHGTDDHLHLVAIGIFPTAGGRIRVHTVDGAHYALYEYTGVSTNDLTGLSQTGISGTKHSDAAYTFPAESIVELADSAEYVNDKIDKNVLTANSLVKADAAATPVVLEVAASRIIGRKASGSIAALTGAEAAAIVAAASDSAQGVAELATTAETTAGNDSGRAVTPDGLAGSIYGRKTVEITVLRSDESLTTGDGKAYFVVPADLNGMNLVDADAAVITYSSSGTPTIQIYNLTQTADMLSTRITIDANEYTSYTAEAAAAIDASNDDVATGDILRIDCDVAGTGTKGLVVILTFETP